MSDRAALTYTQSRSLGEAGAASDERLRYLPGSEGWTRTFNIAGSRAERSSKTLKSLMALGLLEGRKPPGMNQTQWEWRITDAGRAWLAAEEAAGWPSRAHGENA